MKFSSFARLFGGREKLSTRKRRGLNSRPAPALEALEARLVPAGLIPTIVKVTPADGSTALSALPQISVTFSESMAVAGVTNAANYEIFGSTGNPIKVNSVSYNPVSNTATLSYTGNATGGDLTADKYTLFVRGDQLIAADGEPVAAPGQIAVASSGSSTVSIVNMPGDGTLHGISNYSAGLNNSPAAVAIADVSQDGLPDLIVGNFQSDSISIFNGIAGGGFATSPSQTIPLPPGAIAVQGIVAADFMNNGRIDLATANVGSSNVTVFLNQGHGLFLGGTNYAVGGSPDAIVAAQFDPSGFNDLAVARSDGSVAILLNNGVGGFGAPTAIATGRGILNGIDAANLVGSSGHNADIIVGGSLGVAELVNNTTQQGVLSFGTPIVLDTTAVVDVAIGTLTPGGLPSVAAASRANGGEVLVYTNEAGGFSNGIPFSTGAVPTRVRFGDVNGDGFNDLIVSNGGASSGSVSILYNVSGSTFNVSAPVPVDVNPVGLAIHTNAQGVVDLVATANIDANDDSVLRVAGGQFLASTDISVPSSLAQPVVGDLNGDGIPDIVVPNPAGNSVSVFLSKPTGGYLPPQIFSVGNDPVSVALGDIFGAHYANGQPILDMVVANNSDSTVSILQNNGQGIFSTPALPVLGTLAVGKSPQAVLLGDFTGNGIMDLAVAHSTGPFGFQNTAGVTFFLGNGNGTFKSPTELLTGTEAVALAAADFNGDGHLDLAVLAGTFNVFGLNPNVNGTVTILHGNGDGTFQSTPSDVFSTGDNSTSIAVGDLNRDGLPDLVVTDHTVTPTGQQTSSVEVLLNTGNSFSAGIETDVTTSSFAALQSVAVLSVAQDAFPDVVASVGTFTGSQGNINNLVVLKGLGDGKFLAPQFYSTDGGGPNQTPSFFAALSDPFIRVTTFTAFNSTVEPNLVENGTFEAPDLAFENGNLSGWQSASETNSHGNWLIQTGTNSPLGNVAVPPAPQGGYAAMLDQADLTLPYDSPNGAQSVLQFDNSRTPTVSDYQGAHVFYQDITIPANATDVNLSYSLFVNNNSSLNTVGWTDPNANPQLDYLPNQVPQTANQQVRVDLINPAADPFTVTPGPGGVILNLFHSTPADLLEYGYVTDPTTGNPSVSQGTIDLGTQFDGQTIRFRVGEVNNRGRLIVGLDNVQINAVFSEAALPTINGVRLRNPGVGATPTFGGASTDPTIIGHVSDTGSPSNIVSITVDPTGANNFTGPQAFPVPAFDRDALGNFQIMFPSTMLPGPYTINIQAKNRAGNAATTSFSFVLQGPSLTNWQAEGPGPVHFSGPGVNYKTVSGNVTAVAVDPHDASGNTIYIGSDSGGVWKTTDGGTNWTPLTDYLTDATGTPIATAIGALAVDPNNPDTVWAGTGISSTVSTANPGVGLIRSLDGGRTWSQVVAANGTNYFQGARVTRIQISDLNPNNLNQPARVFVAVSQGGKFGPGVYETQDGGKTWSDALNPASMFLDNGKPLGAGFQLASATDVEIDRFSLGENTIWVGLGNVGLTSTSASAGVWKSVNGGLSWQQIVGGHDPKGAVVQHQKIPAGNDGQSDVGQVLITLPGETEAIGPDGLVHPQGRVGDEGTVYAFIDNRKGAVLSFSTGANLDNCTGIFKTSNGGLSWTHVMLRENIQQAFPANYKPTTYDYLDVITTGGLDDRDFSNSLQIDPSDSNIVYWGSSTRFFVERYGIVLGSIYGINGGHAFLRIDTTNMRDTNFLSPFFNTAPLPRYPNDGDDIYKRIDAVLNITSGPLLESGAHYSGKMTQAYVGEGVMWADLEENTIGYSSQNSLQLPSVINALTFDGQDRLLVGTAGGLFRGVNQGWQYDTTSGAGLQQTGHALWSVEATLGVQTPVERGTIFTDLNGNLQIGNVTSVTIDPVDQHGLQASLQSFGWAKTSGTLAWDSTNDPSVPVGGEPDPFNGPAPYGGVIVASPVNPNIPTNPSTIYRTYAGVFIQLVVQLPLNNLEMSTQGGNAGTFNTISTGLPDNSLPVFPLFAVDPNIVQTQGVPANELIYATNEVFRSDNSGQTWNQISQPLVSGNDFISAMTIANTGGINGSNVFYIGTESGKVFVTQNGGGDGFPSMSTGLPKLPVLGLSVDPTNPQLAYAAIGGFSTGQGHIFVTSNGGKTWTNITDGLPDVPAYSVAIDARTTAAYPNGKIWLGTQVGVFISTDRGKSWTKLGIGLPNVPVVNIQFYAALEKLVVATQGRGVWQINTDLHGPAAVGINPSTPVLPGITSIVVTFNKTVDPRTFTTGSVDSFFGPNGPITVLSVQDVDPINHQSFRISFVPQISDGIYTITIGPNITDLVGNPMDQNNNGVNGEPSDTFTAHFTINTTDDGRFITGVYHSLLGRSADTSGFNANIGGVELANSQVLTNVALGLIASAEGRSDLLYNPNITAQHPKATGLFELLLGRAPSAAELSAFLGALNSGQTPEQIIVDLTSSGSEFYNNDAGGTDPGFINQLFVDLLNRPADPSGLTGFVNELAAIEGNGRSSIALALATSPEYRTNLIIADFKKYLNRSPSPAELTSILGGFTTDEQLIAALAATSEFFALQGNNNTNFVNALYHDILNRQADPAGLAGFLNKLQHGFGRADIALQLLRSSEYQQLLITNNFTLYLGRLPAAADFNSLLPILQSGGSDEQLLSTIIGSVEFYQRNANGAASQTAKDQNWLNAAYQGILNRPPDAGGNTGFLQALSASEQSSRATIANIIVTSNEYRSDLITNTYQTFLGRGPGVSEISFWLPVVSQPPAGAGHPSPDEQFEAAVLGSGEYFNKQHDSSTPPVATNVQWLTSVYNNVLDRAPDPSGFANSLTGLLNGFQTQRLRVTTGLDTSFEYQNALVNTLFQKFLRRQPTQAELTQRIAQLETGMTDEQLIGVMLASPEYFQNPKLGGSSNSTWLNQVYLDLLGRPRDTGSQPFLDGLNNGSLTRAQVAAALLASPEYRTDLINRYYSLYLNRSPSPAETGSWLNSFAVGATDEQVIAAITASNEYFELQHPFP